MFSVFTMKERCSSSEVKTKGAGSSTQAQTVIHEQLNCCVRSHTDNVQLHLLLCKSSVDTSAAFPPLSLPVCVCEGGGGSGALGHFRSAPVSFQLSAGCRNAHRSDGCFWLKAWKRGLMMFVEQQNCNCLLPGRLQFETLRQPLRSAIPLLCFMSFSAD